MWIVVVSTTSCRCSNREQWAPRATHKWSSRIWLNLTGFWILKKIFLFFLVPQMIRRKRRRPFARSRTSHTRFSIPSSGLVRWVLHFILASFFNNFRNLATTSHPLLRQPTSTWTMLPAFWRAWTRWHRHKRYYFPFSEQISELVFL